MSLRPPLSVCLQGARQGHEDLLQVHVIIRDLLKKVRSYPPESLGNTIAGESPTAGVSHVVTNCNLHSK